MQRKDGTRPMVIDETPGKKWYCQCGLSQRLPYCDGTHKQHDVGVGPIAVEITEPVTKAICQCHRTQEPPWCDGSHRMLDG